MFGGYILQNEAKKSFLINLLFVLSITILVFFTGKMLFSYLLPFVIAIIIASLVQKPAHYLSTKTKIKSGTLSLIMALLLFLSFSAIIVFVIYRFSILLGTFLKELPDFLNLFTSLISKIEDKLTVSLKKISPEFSQSISEIINGIINNITKKATEGFSRIATITAKKTPSFLLNSIITLAASCFIAKDFDSLKNFISLLLGKKIYSNILKIKEILSTSVVKILKGYFLLFLLTFSELTIGFLLLKIKYAPLLALAIAVVDLLPVLGTGVVLIPWGILELFIGKTSVGISILVLYAVITVVRNFAEPKIIGGQIGIHPLFTLLSIFIGLKFFGFAGIFILPITLIVIFKYYKAEIDEENKLMDNKQTV